jgi:tRNA threonylcarbamoyl adenosine modification protein YeaZ
VYTLFIDTHYKDVLLALYKDKKLLDKSILSDIKSTSVDTMPALVKLLGSNNIQPKDINKIAVCIGPGSFTGTRIGVTIAKTMAYSLNIPIVSLTSIDLVGLNLDSKSYVSVLENNGAFVALYDKKLIDEIKYLKEDEYLEFKKDNNVIEDIELNYDELINFINNLKEEKVHDVNPIYVKTIEALK